MALAINKLCCNMHVYFVVNYCENGQLLACTISYWCSLVVFYVCLLSGSRIVVRIIIISVETFCVLLVIWKSCLTYITDCTWCFTYNVCFCVRLTAETKWPFMCWWVVKKLLTYSSDSVVSYIMFCDNSFDEHFCTSMNVLWIKN